MTAHSGFPWKPNDPITDDLITEVANCVNFNKLSAVRAGGYTPGAYAVLSPVDNLIYGVCVYLDSCKKREEKVGRASLDEFAAKAPPEVLEIFEKTLKHMGLWVEDG